MRALALLLPVILALVGCTGLDSGDAGVADASPPQPEVARAVASDDSPETLSAPSRPTTTTPADPPPAERAAVGGSSSTVTGVVIAVDGDLSEIRGFSILLTDGSTLDLVPEPGLLFAGGSLSHVRDHMVSGSPVRVEYEQAGDLAVVTEIGDAD